MSITMHGGTADGVEKFDEISVEATKAGIMVGDQLISWEWIDAAQFELRYSDT